ncbi:hypothetical protein BS50DRAFT_576516 [Corynespora cassiicola Philippines]|uniref:Uncharacterized protein n=1 Tax=Corynespora cassiicola Philippines TaxID=1448308 RepID=A0A2T2NEM8_CORCC|nr:hypothetical protein BS50DRAFT_576516 [Corynespora cassiicola Philippines]
MNRPYALSSTGYAKTEESTKCLSKPYEHASASHMGYMAMDVDHMDRGALPPIHQVLAELAFQDGSRRPSAGSISTTDSAYASSGHSTPLLSPLVDFQNKPFERTDVLQDSLSFANQSGYGSQTKKDFYTTAACRAKMVEGHINPRTTSRANRVQKAAKTTRRETSKGRYTRRKCNQCTVEQRVKDQVKADNKAHREKASRREQAYLDAQVQNALLEFNPRIRDYARARSGREHLGWELLKDNNVNKDVKPFYDITPLYYCKIDLKTTTCQFIKDIRILFDSMIERFSVLGDDTYLSQLNEAVESIACATFQPPRPSPPPNATYVAEPAHKAWL